MIDSHQLIYNGDFYPVDQAIIPVNNRAFRYGDSLFETIRVIDGKPCLLPLHVARLKEGMKALSMDWNAALNPDVLRDKCLELCHRNEISYGGRIRLTVFRNEGGYYTPDDNGVSYCMEAIPILSNWYQLNEHGLQIDIYDQDRKRIDKLSPLKTGNCLSHVLAGIYRKEKGLDECIVINEHGNIAEAISSNIFVVYNGVFYTPALNQGCIAGIMRRTVIDISKERGIEVQECPLGPNALLRADEVFLTNSIHGVQWVKGYKMKRYFHNISQLLVENLNNRVASSMMDLQGN